MKKGKLNLDKKAITKLSEESLENVQGGGSKICCTNITVEEEAEELAPDAAGTIVISCKK